MRSRRMMMTSGTGIHYKFMFDAGAQIIQKEGTKLLFKDAVRQGLLWWLWLSRRFCGALHLPLVCLVSRFISIDLFYSLTVILVFGSQVWTPIHALTLVYRIQKLAKPTS